MEVIYYKDRSILFIQQKYIKTIFNQFNIFYYNPAPSLIAEKILMKAPLEYEAAPELLKTYREMEGSLMYLITRTRPDICYAVSRLDNNTGLDTWTDATWVEDLDDKKSTNVYVFRLGGTSIVWASYKQLCVAHFTYKIEYLGQSIFAINIVWL